MTKPLIRIVAALAALSSAPVMARDGLAEQIQSDLPGLMAIYRDLHQNPELSFQEVRSARIMARSPRVSGSTTANSSPPMR